MPLWDRGAVLDSQSRSLNSGIALCALIVRTQIGSSVQDPPEWGWGGGVITCQCWKGGDRDTVALGQYCDMRGLQRASSQPSPLCPSRTTAQRLSIDTPCVEL